MRKILLLAVAMAIVVPVIQSPSMAVAQDDDWNVRTDPFDRRLIRRYKAILARNPADTNALNKLSRLYKRYRTLKLLIDQYKKELTKSPKKFSALVILGHLELAEGRRDQALALYERAAAVKPGSAAVQVSLAALYRRSGEADKARAAYDKALAAAKKKPLKKRILRALADIALDKGDIAGAKAYFENYIALDPKNVQARVELGDALVSHKRYKEALEVFKKAEAKLKSDPAQRVEVITRIGATHEAAGDTQAAIREYRRAMAMTRRGYYLRKELTARIVDIYRRKQDLSSLLGYYESKWKTNKRGHFEWDVLARLYEETGLQEKAIHAFRKATKKAPYELDTQRRFISLLENSGREKEAIKQYEVVARVAPGEPRFQLELAERYWRADDQKRALALAKKIRSRFSGDAGVHAALADLYTRWGKEDLALKSYEQLTRIEPSEVSHLVNLGEQHFQRNDKKKAIAVWKKILRKKSAENYARLGEVYAEHDMSTEALAMYSKAIKLKPKKSDFFKGRAGVYERKSLYSLAIADWEHLLALLPDKGSYKMERKDARRRIVHLLRRWGLKHLNTRISKWERERTKDRHNLNAAAFLVAAYLRKDNMVKARGVLEGILAVAPNDQEAMHDLVKVYRDQSEFDLAIAILLRLAKKTPSREREYYNQIAEIKTILHEDDEAIAYQLKALEKSPNDPVAHQQLAQRHESMQQYDKAVKAYEKTIELDPRNYKAYFALARLYRNQNKLSKAAALYREILKRATTEEILHKAGRQAINLEELTKSLDKLERIVSPLAFTFGHKQVYRRILVELYDRLVPALVAKVRRGNASERKKAAADLKQLGSHGLMPLLEALADEQDVAQQRIAVSVLGYLGNKGAAPPLVNLARQSTGKHPTRRPRIGTILPTLGWDVRVEALAAAGRLGDPRTIPSLIDLTSHREGAMREAATFALGMTGDKRAVAPLLVALDDRIDSVQTLACLGLSRVGGGKSLKRIIDVVKNRKKRDDTRSACAFALGVIGETSAVTPLGKVLSEGNDQVHRTAAWALGRIGDKRGLSPLLAAYFTKRAHVRAAVAWALPRVAAGKRGGDDVIRFMDYPMRNGKFDSRRAIRELLGRLDKPKLAPMLIIGREREIVAGLREGLHRHRDLVIRVLNDLNARDDGLALGPLTAGIDHLSADKRRAVDAVLARVGDAIFEDLEQLAKHRDPDVRRRTMSVVAKTGGQGAVAILMTGLSDKRSIVRHGAMLATAHLLRHRKAPELASAVVAKLRSDDWQERVAAATAVGRLGTHADTAALIKVLGDPKSFVREAAAKSLGRLKPRSAVARLAKLSSAEHEPVALVRLAAVRALLAVGTPTAQKAVRAARTDRDPGVRAAAGAK